MTCTALAPLTRLLEVAIQAAYEAGARDMRETEVGE